MNRKSIPKRVRRKIRILSLDGGGIRGILHLVRLAVIEEITGEPIYKYFDTMIGTSTGGLITILLAISGNDGTVLSAKDALLFYIANSSIIFPHIYLTWCWCFILILISLIIVIVFAVLTANYWDTKRLAIPFTVIAVIFAFLLSWSCYKLIDMLKKSKYTEKGLLKVIESRYGKDVTLKNAKTCIGIVSTEKLFDKAFVFNSAMAKKYPKNPLHNTTIYDIARATCAAPSFFPPITIKTGILTSLDPQILNSFENNLSGRGEPLFEDGGTSRNNPTFLGYKLTKYNLKNSDIEIEDCDVQILSLGTGSLSGRQDYLYKSQGKRKRKGIDSFCYTICCHYWFCRQSCYKCCDFTKPSGGLVNIMYKRLIKEPYEVDQKVHLVHLKMVKMSQEFSFIQYTRLQFKLEEYQLLNMDDVTRKNIHKLLLAAFTQVLDEKDDNSKEFKKFLGISDKDLNAVDLKAYEQNLRRILLDLNKNELKNELKTIGLTENNEMIKPRKSKKSNEPNISDLEQSLTKNEQ